MTSLKALNQKSSHINSLNFSYALISDIAQLGMSKDFVDDWWDRAFVLKTLDPELYRKAIELAKAYKSNHWMFWTIDDICNFFPVSRAFFAKLQEICDNNEKDSEIIFYVIQAFAKRLLKKTVGTKKN